MKLHPNHVVAAATVFVIAALVELSGSPEAASSASPSDPSLPSASAALAGSNAASGNVQDLTY